MMSKEWTRTNVSVHRHHPPEYLTIRIEKMYWERLKEACDRENLGSIMCDATNLIEHAELDEAIQKEEGK